MHKLFDSRKCDKLMKEILDRLDAFGEVGYPQNIEFLSQVQSDLVSRRMLDVLAARDYITLTVDAGNSLVCIHVNDKGVTYFEDRAESAKEKSRQTRRYWITTGIAITALVKAFLPEICAAAAWLSTLLAPR